MIKKDVNVYERYAEEANSNGLQIMLNKLGDIPFDFSYEMLQNDLWNIGSKYGVTGVEVFKILMENFPVKGKKDEEK